MEETTDSDGRMEGKDDSMALKQWTYRGEGNHNIVLAHKQDKLVYRLAKRQSTVTGLPLPINGQSMVEESLVRQRATLNKRVEFMRHVLAPLLGESLVNDVRLVDLSPSFTDSLCTDVIRPAIRDYSDQDEVAACQSLVFPFALCMPDFCFNGSDHNNNPAPTFAIDLKPNVLFMTETCSDCSANHRQGDLSLQIVRENMCRACFTKKCKVQKGKWARDSNVCPMDLISGNPERMRFALSETFKEPHHRLRVYKNGKAIFKHGLTHDLETHIGSHFGYTSGNETVGCVDHLIEVIMKALLFGPDTKHISSQASPTSDITYANDAINYANKANHPHSTDAKAVSNFHKVSTDSSRCKNRDSKKSSMESPLKMSQSEEPVACPCDTDVVNSPCKCILTVNKMCQASLFARTKKGLGPSPGLPSGCALDILCKAQRLSGLTAATVQPYFKRVMDLLNSQPQLKTDYCIDGPYNTEIWANVVGDPECKQIASSDSIEYAIRKVQQFQTWLTLKSTSIMITLQPIPRQKMSPSDQPTPVNNGGTHKADTPCEKTHHLLTDDCGNVYILNINVLDLDPKPMAKIGKIFTQDQEDFEFYLKYMNR